MERADLGAKVRRYWTDVFGAGDIDVLSELFADPYTRHSGAGTVARTISDFRADVTRYRATLSSVTATFHSQTVDGDLVWTRLTASGLNRETGETHSYQWLSLHRFEQGKVAESWELYQADVDWG